MSDVKFTKGEWQWEHDKETACTISVFNFNGIEICRLQSEDDAHLIAAAPEMYEAIVHVLEMQLRGFIVLGDEVTYKLQKSLAKARGES